MSFIGTETEYGIATPSDTALSPIVTSTHAVVAFSMKDRCANGARWNFADEHPLRDSRGFDLRRYHSIPIIDPNAIGVANTVLTNGGRFYVDHAHPEYSSPETTNAYDAMLYDVAGDLILNRAVELVAEQTAMGKSILEHHDPCPPLKIYKNNVDGKGASYGSHENYMYHRTTDFNLLAQSLIPFFVARQVVVGAGRVGLGQLGEKPGFQISQRADYIEQEISLETTLNRGIINTRDEPHANAENYGRLHVIIGDANMSHTSIFLKLGMTSLVIDAIEKGVDFSDLKLSNAVAEVSAVSRDLELTHCLTLSDGRKLTALELLTHYRERLNATTDVQKRVLDAWDEVIEALRKGPEHASHLLDWCAKLTLIRSYVARGVSIADAKIKLIDLQYSDIDPAKSLFYALVRKGRMCTLATPEEIAHAAWKSPLDSRAYFRGRIIESLPGRIVAANWESIIIADKTTHLKINLPRLDTLCFSSSEKIFENFNGDTDDLIKSISDLAAVERLLPHSE
ncbi:proteasome accessory factor PafA2 [Corynebacterium pseudotuberculosis]|uniref:Proteasome accessory factor PafA2 n=1 Tax=Corynebacterium pseudotuberculosis 258 TaxID=1168865 RepID=A0AAU8PQ94_CORPS|nr:depupylase/deamidase Dop [Corynebacterium pseudotuberculosis]AER69087.1 Proteasome accessory factor PafA2 [Corynebacterium pseudotuberculosis 1/06-A]AEQ06589.1 proteasome accessory factor PafA2 [Corynebacterium pseudotuberculosis CIP 52.97]AFB72386.1 proteasome accessory factor PafA2 [Corynebacterium pseudotuberculosis 316]AFK16683.1 proteasome accessory factor PafA2 [Corynebacterium pseudotuberculosis 258]AKS13379.1 Proteasome accessory factor PafA2 [Corynebacterium pseudotuberculosis]